MPQSTPTYAIPYVLPSDPRSDFPVTHQAQSERIEALHAGAVIWDAPQTLTDPQEKQARVNIAGAIVDHIVFCAVDHGIIGDGVTDEAATFQAFLDAATAAGAVAQLAPGTVVRIASQSISAPTGLRLDLNGSTIRSALPGGNDRLIIVNGCTDVQIGNGTIDGDKASYAAATEQRHNLHLVNSQRVILHDLLSINAKGDGIYIGDDVSGPCSDIIITNATVATNHRNGESLTAGKRIHHYGCRYTGNGGTAPQAGVDIEPNTDAANWEMVTFDGCVFDANLWDGVLVQAKSAAPTARQAGVSFTDCDSVGNGTAAAGNADTGNGLVIRWARDVTWSGGSLRGNYLRGVWFRDTCSNLRFDTSVIGNGNEGYLQKAGTITDLVIRGYINGNGSLGTFSGISLSGGGSRAHIEAMSTGNTGYGLRTTPSWSSVSIGAGCRLSTNTSGTSSLADDLGTRSVLAQELGWRIGGTATNAVAISTRMAGDVNDRIGIRVDGRLQWGPGTGPADVTLERVAPDVIGLSIEDVLRLGHNTTDKRPSAVSAGPGGAWYDISLAKPIFSDGTVWREAADAAATNPTDRGTTAVGPDATGGQIVVPVTFASAFATVPIVTATGDDSYLQVGVRNATTTGFELLVSYVGLNYQDTAIPASNVNWTAVE